MMIYRRRDGLTKQAEATAQKAHQSPKLNP